jgi:exosortase
MGTGTKINAFAPAVAAGTIVCLTAWVHHPTLVWLYERYTAADSYYSHGFLVPAVTCGLIWARRERLAGIPVLMSRTGLAVSIAALCAHLAGLALQVNFISGFSLLFLIAGIVLFLFGKHVTARIAGPLSFLLFMIPLPLVAVNFISFPLKVLVCRNTAAILHYAFGVPLSIEGFRIIFPNASLTIENPCSGLRSLIVMLALGFVFAYLSETSLLKRISLFLLAVPVAVAANILRVLLLSLAVYVYGEGLSRGFFHDLTGYIAFAAAFGGLYGFWRIFQCRP